MNKVFAVVRREFIERVRTRAFLIGTLIVPLMMLLFGYLPQVLMRANTRTRTLVILDATTDSSGIAAEAALRGLTIRVNDSIRPRYHLERVATAVGALPGLRDRYIERIGIEGDAAQGLDGVLVLTDSSVTTGNVAYFGSNVASFQDMDAMEDALEPLLRQRRLERLGADPATVAASAVKLRVDSRKVTQGKLTGESGASSFMLAYITSFIMYFSLIMYGIQIMGAVLEEKTNRIVEVLVSSITPFQLLLGKVIGVAGAGLLQLGIWGGASFIVSSRFARAAVPAGSEQTAIDGTQQTFSMPTISAELIGVILLFFLLGFLLYSALYAAVGAMCSSQQETQQAAQPVTIILAVGFITIFSMINDPSSALARTLSFVPFFAPLVIPVRYALTPLSAVEVLGAAVATAIGLVVVVWVAGRIYRVGILSYGKRPTFREVWSWVRTG
jgi:ABC-2 type transport system permease protein